jgi:signal transduction histidine kinase
LGEGHRTGAQGATDERSGSEPAITIPGIGDQDRAERAITMRRNERSGWAGTRTISETRRVLKALAPTALETSGIVGAVRQVLDEFARDHEWTVRFNENLGTTAFPRRLETAMFRIVQEALTNVAHHAAASRVDVELWHADGELRVLIHDDGRGFQFDGQPGTVGLGLLSMRQRAAALGGVLVIEAPPARGTLISVRFPYASAV